MRVGKKGSEGKEGSKAKLIADSSSFLSGKKKEVPDCFSYVNIRMQLIKLK